MITFHFLTLFPETIHAYTDASILGRAQSAKRIKIKTYNLLDFTEKSTRGSLPKRVDDKPYGGGPGMVVRAKPVMKALKKAIGTKKHVQIIHFSPSGHVFNQALAQNMAQKAASKELKHIIFICGRYEGIDARIEEMYPGLTISLGDFVLTGGELPALTMTDAIARHIPGVLGDPLSIEEHRPAASKCYTRPEVIRYKGKDYGVPEILLSGDHKKIDEWRKSN